MLARLADNLFWMGRYVERSEHLARYIKTQYLVSLDAPIAQKKDFALASIYRLAGLNMPPDVTDESLLLRQVILDAQTPVSILYSVGSARENARGARDLLSSELWETLNKYYHFVHNQNGRHFHGRSLFEFTQQVVDFCTVIRGSIATTLLQDEAWAFIQLGLHLERAIQIVRILQTKLHDLEELPEDSSPTVVGYHLYSLLTSCEASDMSRRYYHRVPTRHTVLDFLILNEHFPRSLLTCLLEVEKRLAQVRPDKIPIRESVEFRLGKLVAALRYTTNQEIEADPLAYLEEVMDSIHEVSDHLAGTYLHY